MADLIKKSAQEVVYYTSPQLSYFPGLRHGFFTRKGGVSTGAFESMNFRFINDDKDLVMRNYQIGAELLGKSADNIIRTDQSHTDVIAQVTAHRGFSSALGGEPVDAIITASRDVVLTGFFADCQLLLLYDKQNHAIGVVHSGWRGIANQISRKTIEKMSLSFGTRPRDLVVAVGPSICRNCFETDDDVYDALAQSYGGQIIDSVYRVGSKWHIDLKSITYSLLINSGVNPLNIDISNDCPCCGDKSLWWSHRRQGEERGVHAGMIALK